jgi:hypothetical protein
MREWNRWHANLVKKLASVEDLPFSEEECPRFIEVEYCLRLRDHLAPEQPCGDVWTLLTGYSFPGVNDTPEKRRICLIARHRVRYLRTATSWRQWLSWYANQRADLRLYDVDLQTGSCQQRMPLTFMPERIAIYDAAIELVPQHRRRYANWAQATDYTFPIMGETYNVRLPAYLTRLNPPPPSQELPPPKERVPLEIPLEDLERTASLLQQCDPQGDWVRRVSKLSLDLIQQGCLQQHARRFTIDSIFHLVGMVDAGKSTLIFVLIYYLVVERHLHVTLVLNTVAESIHMAATLRRIGITATPALGMDRGVHRLKYGLAHARSLQVEDLFHPQAEENPALEWVTGTCALSGAMTAGGPIPSGYEPCYTLMDAQSHPHQCPVRPVCPNHQASQDLPTSQVWIVNPASFLHSRAPDGLCRADLRLLEAIYRVSDVLMIDEADRVQVQWDRAYAPVDNLTGAPEALLDWLDVTITDHINKHERRPLSKSRYKELNLIAGEADPLAGQLFYLLLNHKDLVDWTNHMPVTNSVIYAELVDALSRPRPRASIDPSVHSVLAEDLKNFLEHPTSLQGTGVLAEWVNDVRYDEEIGLSTLLAGWLQQRVPWSLSDHPDMPRLLRRLEFAVVLAAMDKRVDDLLRNWLWAAAEMGQHRMLEHHPPQEYIDLVPESLLGNLLGYQYVERGSGEGGLLKYIQCYGIGRWLLTNLPWLYMDLDGLRGPHLFLTSATSWAPESSQFHLVIPPHAILSAPQEERDAIEQSVFEFMPIPQKDGSLITVSGIQGEDRLKNLEKLARYLGGADDPTHPSCIDQELEYWRRQGTPRKVLLVVGSYIEAKTVTKCLLGIAERHYRVVSMLPDEDESLDAWVIRRGEVEELKSYQADVIVTPLLAIQRGFNILDEAGGALLGSAFFLVRPYPVPDDLAQHVVGINHWVQSVLTERGGLLPPEYGSTGAEAMSNLRRTAYSEWFRRLTANQAGLDGLPEDLYRQLLWDQFIVVWQTIGRLVRRGRKAHIFFVDAAFHPRDGRRRSMLKGWYEMLHEYLGPGSTKSPLEQLLASTLYGPAYRALQQLVKHLSGDEVSGGNRR